ncbi:THUMP-like domain-containing protein [Leptobacterium sp. I13]|uniref:class I SAM-dependent methyltransferase n=1 Tax=Leptobacterium meishanense TaxID=3128904 RepID=UPI0030ECF6A1
MNKNILKTGIQNFIDENLNTDTSSVLFKNPDFDGVKASELAEQLISKKKSEKKLPTWFNTPKIYYPNKLAIEQTSSEITAAYKASLVNGKSLVDLTGGFGIDSFYFAKLLKEITYLEINPELVETVSYNYQVLGVDNIEIIHGDGIEFLKKTSKKFDWIYLDPSRRNNVKGKVFMLQDCIPNVPGHIDLLFDKTENILIKTAPLLDISIGIKELRCVKEIHVVAVKNEVKELLWILNSHSDSKVIKIKAVNIKNKKRETFEFLFHKEKQAGVTYAAPKKYLYEPNSAIMKTGAFNSIAKYYKLDKLHLHSHLYTSDNLISFPGRTFEIINSFPYQRKLLKSKLKTLKKANISTRNFPESVAQIRKKLNIKDGGDDYLFFTTDYKGVKIGIYCKKY